MATFPFLAGVLVMAELMEFGTTACPTPPGGTGRFRLIHDRGGAMSSGFAAMGAEGPIRAAVEPLPRVR